MRVILLSLIVGCHGQDGKSPGDDDATDTDTDTPPPDACDGRDDGAFCDDLTAVTCAGGDVAASETCADECVDGACVTCGTLAVDLGDGLVPDLVVLATDPAPFAPERAWHLRPVFVTGGATVELTGPYEVVDGDGVPVTGTVRDTTAFLRATDDGTGSVTFTPAPGCDGDPVTLALASRPVPRLAGLPLAVAPGFDDGPDLFLAGHTIGLDVPAGPFADRVGVRFDAWLVPHRETTADWADPDLASPDAVGPISGRGGTPIDLGPAPDGGAWSSWDVVADFDRDGTLSPGDLLQGFDGRPIVIAGDLAGNGPHPTTQADDPGAVSFLAKRIYWPTDLDTLDPMPLVVISHGNGHDYRWYDYLGTQLASWGYVVVAHRNNTQPGPVAASRTTVGNTDDFLGSLPTWNGGVLDGEVDGSAIVWIGHSRGGEGVVLAYRDLLDGSQTAVNFSASDVVLVSSIAPTLFEGPQEADPGEVPYHLISGSADGDVTGGVDQSLLQYYRIFQGATAQRYVTLVEGADHNDFNCCGSEDWRWAPQPGPIVGRARAQMVAKAYHLALLESTFHGRSELLELFTQSPLRSMAFGPLVRIASQYEPAVGDARVVEDFQTNSDPTVSSSGGAVTTDLRNVDDGPLNDANATLAWSPTDPMNGMSWTSAGDTRPANGMVFDWDDGDDRSLELEILPADQDLSDFDALSFRACQGTRHPNTVALGADLTFGVALVDASGNTVEVPLAPFGAVPAPYARGGAGTGVGWVNEFQTVRLPLSAFERMDPAFDRRAVVAIRFLFGAAHGSALGRLGLDDIEFSKELP